MTQRTAGGAPSLVDANVLIYAVDTASTHHSRAKSWIDEALAGTQTVLMPWVSLLAFVRLTTHPRIFERPLTPETALGIVEGWLGCDNVVAPEPDTRHVRRLTDLLAATGGRGGNLVNDAHLAALAVQWGARVVTFDSDFGRFPGVHWFSPA
ncbi:TA system VapC family ribonuclease toxin [Serinibacter salmoneus]|uniref:Ribonuclease VapC n=1 Tax=Serinibacter salmoneus TaxID=556530 RepID=A0A2A9CX60_9MICO|nr:TA system VapC family ribonuclease toxin [Serinibacter salmoneus]PFG19027.1 hypothetical protein ATL40_0581 [Serinibacter salmoneus]